MKTLQQLCLDALNPNSRDPQQQAVKFEGNWYTWGQLQQVGQELQQALNSLRIDATAPVVFVPRNRPSVLAALLGLMSQGRNVHILYAFQSPASLMRQIEEQAPAAVIASSCDLPAEVTNKLQALGIPAIALDEMQVQLLASDGTQATSTAVEDSSISSLENPTPYLQILTSGTTGTPKQFPISYELIAKWMVGRELREGRASAASLSGDTPTLLFFPIGNITGIYSTISPLVKGQRVCLLDRFNLEQWHQYVVQYRPQASGMAPAALQMLMDADIPKDDLASVKTMGVGAAPLDPTVQRAFEERYGIPVLLSYGATEFAGPVTAMTRQHWEEFGQSKFGSVGRVLPGGFQIRVINPDTFEALPAGEEGLLEVISPRIGEDWIRTSDIGLIDDDGFLFICGRADGAIMRGGFKVLPETVEKALLEHPSVLAVSVVGIADQRLTEVPAAAVQIKRNCSQPSIEELEKHLRERLLATQIPVHWRFVEELPKTPSFKVHRPGVKGLFV